MAQILTELHATLLFELTLELGAPKDVGQTPWGRRRIVPILGGKVAGERLSGTVLPGCGTDWAITRGDGAMALDVRLLLETHDGALISMTYRGVRHGPAAVLERLARGEPTSPSEYYLRIGATFETGENGYAWLNRIIAVGVGERLPQSIRYNVFEVL